MLRSTAWAAAACPVRRRDSGSDDGTDSGSDGGTDDGGVDGGDDTGTDGDKDGCNCSSTSAPGGMVGAFGLFLVALVGLRRRER
ncbi:MAG: MYXO-CTERM sorting domain-containing protein [Alphaproteobacteria bacterium]|nr:MYXO-CTERM sorting domain-containing protein [Alphaproteobacteria bacterium]